LNPTLAVLNTTTPSAKKWSLATFLSNRKRRLGILWLGALLTGSATLILRDIRAGTAALDLPVSAWTGIQQTLTSPIGEINGELIRREDEYRLLYSTAFDGHDRPPIWS
jgi:hypothetical protein